MRRHKPKRRRRREEIYIYRPEYMPARERFGWLRVRDDDGKPWRVTGWGVHPLAEAKTESEE